MSLIAVCPCSTSRSVTLNFTPPNPAPLGGYHVRWRIIDSNGLRGVWNESTHNTSPIVLSGIPACCAIEGEIKSSCGIGPDGTTLFGPITNFTAPATATYTASIAVVSCTNGNGSYTLTGTPGQSVKVRLNMGGSITHNNVNGNCAWLYGRVSGGGSFSSGVSSGTTPGGTSVQQLSSSVEIIVQIPSTGNVNLITEAKVYNATSLSAVSANLQIVSVDNVSISGQTYTICVLLDTAQGCAPQP